MSAAVGYSCPVVRRPDAGAREQVPWSWGRRTCSAVSRGQDGCRSAGRGELLSAVGLEFCPVIWEVRCCALWAAWLIRGWERVSRLVLWIACAETTTGNVCWDA